MDERAETPNDWQPDGGLVAKAVQSVHRELGNRIAGVAVFGSQARGDVHEGSDLDLAVLPRESIDPVELWKLAQLVAARCQCDVDLVDLWRASTVLKQQVVVTGSWVLVDDRDLCEHFEASTFTRYGHLNDERRTIVEEFMARNGGEGPDG